MKRTSDKMPIPWIQSDSEGSPLLIDFGWSFNQIIVLVTILMYRPVKEIRLKISHVHLDATAPSSRRKVVTANKLVEFAFYRHTENQSSHHALPCLYKPLKCPSLQRLQRSGPNFVRRRLQGACDKHLF